MTRWFEITPGDAWFFRDARPFNQADPAQMAVPSLFPPFPTTVVGLLRAALARACGWSGRGPWDETVKAQLGDGDDLKALRFSGPYVVRGREVLFPAPTILFARREPVLQGWELTEAVRLAPAPLRDGLRTDFGPQPVRLPVFDEPPLKEGEPERERPDPMFGQYFLTADGLRRVLQGEVPDQREHIVERAAVIAPEARVRLEIGSDTGTAVTGMLFATEFARPASSTALIVGLDGLDDGEPPYSPVAFGGENRWAWIAEKRDEPDIPEAPEVLQRADNGDVLYTAILLTPADLPCWPGPDEKLKWQAPDGTWQRLPGQVVSAALDRPLRPGEWRSFGPNSGPQDAPPLLPAGSTWFLRAPAAAADEIPQWHRSRIGRRTAWGFGEIVVGTWRDRFAQEDKP